MRASAQEGLARAGYEVEERFLSGEACGSLLAAVARRRERAEAPLVVRRRRGRSLRYRVLDGHATAEMPELEELYARVQRRAEAGYGRPLFPLRDDAARLNVNITPPGGAYRWHYDRNAVTGVLYLQAVRGGEIELYPNYRIALGPGRLAPLQRPLDLLLEAPPVRAAFGRRVSIAPEPGMLVLMRGERSLHSVAEVRGERERICVVMAWDGDEGGSSRAALDRYLFSQQAAGTGDPNYGDPNYGRTGERS